MQTTSIFFLYSIYKTNLNKFKQVTINKLIKNKSMLTNIKCHLLHNISKTKLHPKTEFNSFARHSPKY